MQTEHFQSVCLSGNSMRETSQSAHVKRKNFKQIEGIYDDFVYFKYTDSQCRFNGMHGTARHGMAWHITHSEWCGCLFAWENKFNRCSIFIAFSMDLVCFSLFCCFWFSSMFLSLWHRKALVSRAHFQSYNAINESMNQ